MTSRHTSVLLTLALAGMTSAQPVKLDALANARQYQGALNAAQRGALSTQGFVIIPAQYAQFSDVYENLADGDQPVFVTSDAVLHTYHLVFDKALRDLERESLAPTVSRLTGLLVQDSLKRLQELKGTPLEADARRALAYLAVAQKLIDPARRPPAEVASLVKAELRLIEAHQGFAASPVFQDTAQGDERLLEDYS